MQTQQPQPYDLAIIGSGGAGFAAAIAARRRGLEVVMVERSTVGGTCVNTGCVPSKALLAAAAARHVALEHRFPGIRTSAGPVDLPALLDGKHELVEGLRADKYADVAARHGWEIVHGTARFAGTAEDPWLDVRLPDGRATIIRARHYLVTTGATPWAPPIDGLDDAGYLTSTTAMELESLPESMLILGGNAVGLELAQLFARLGVDVTVVEILDRLAPYEEPEISHAIEGIFADDGIAVATSATITNVRRDEHSFTVTVETGGEPVKMSTEQLLVATGRRPATAGLGLDAVGAKVGDRGQVMVDDHLRTTNPRIWAAGDVTGHAQFVYVAAAHGGLAVDNASGQNPRALDYANLPRVTFTSPAIASVGLTDTELGDEGMACECRVLPLEHIPRALVDRDTRGVIKLVTERETGRVRGIHMVGGGAADAILAGVYALQADMTTQQLADSWAPYLTMAEGLKLAAQAFTRDLSELSCCAA
jgi:mercuric reductase